MRSVTVQFLKYPGALHWGMKTRMLGDDEWGTWLAMPEGSHRWKGEEPRTPSREARVLCVPHSGWWVLSHNGPGPDKTHFIDIATPAVWSDGRVEMIDLDLDVVIHQDGRVVMEDEDEFLEHQILYGYPRVLIEGARTEGDRIMAAVMRREEPFFAVASQWLAQVPSSPDQ